MTARHLIAALMPVVWRLGTGKDVTGLQGRDALAALLNTHRHVECGASASSRTTDLLSAWLDDDCLIVRTGAAVALGHIAPWLLLSEVAQRVCVELGRDGPHDEDFPAERRLSYERGIRAALATLDTQPFVDAFDAPWALVGPEDDFNERKRNICLVIVTSYGDRPVGEDVLAFLEHGTVECAP